VVPSFRDGVYGVAVRNRPEGTIVISETHQLVFIGGLHRSGTSPFARCLAAHPMVSGFSDTGVEEDEGQHLQDVMPTGQPFGGPGRFALDPNSSLTETSPLVSPDNAERLSAQWSKHWDLSSPVLIEKSPPNIVRMRFLQALFPSSSFIMVVRHPVIVSLSTKKWAKGASYDTLFDNWFAAHDTMRRDAPQIQRLHIVKYEDLVLSPDDVLAETAEFLHLDGTIPSDSLQGGRSSSYEQTWDEWRSSFNPVQRLRSMRLVRKYATRAAEYGYSMDRLHTAKPLAL
jgi:Sulfotransferase family